MTGKLTEVLQEAFTRRGKPEIVNTGHGSQFSAHAFVHVVKEQGCKLSMDGRGAWRDNVFMDRLWKSVKYERVYLYAYASVTEARTSSTQYLGWYTNPDRIRVWASRHRIRRMP
ncbi:MAG: hypothetical protein ABI856_03210 [Nitrospira sp.]